MKEMISQEPMPERIHAEEEKVMAAELISETDDLTIPASKRNPGDEYRFLYW
ncbi:hypothetical protein [Brevibacillus fulvus]|uniref:Uncharacterized protein n=1 Tax=Brevibacillus fulvus TaxID=1125967 RepID=A0A939BUV1_9BACL|nr:hypothetical protein [Brevibacillus fulvus]MBM7590809.1 hypothetical protein [Brevibacillus fulvus]